MNLADLRENPHAWKRCWRVATHEDRVSPENRGRGDGEVVERLPHGKNPGTVHEQVQKQRKSVCLRPKRSN
ncbi:hypothetical protein E2C01_056012 [Portunus trituberculatus]|uniref:Uncharacterized protein n=1 Tax=Portunus trituberculatus TaxID=210409 RepID=A0A5B7GX38_PORTR|nr:hypothetical protein [Portunus trituberculatus]